MIPRVLESYARSDGWVACRMTPEPAVGSTFEWAERRWEVVMPFNLPCGCRLVCVRAVSSGLWQWSGIECPEHPGDSYTMETTL